jgi:hypothetical protein
MTAETTTADTHDTMVNRDTIINNRSGFPLVQWLALMLTIIGMGVASLVYITSMGKDLALNQQAIEQTKENQSKFETQTGKDLARFEIQYNELRKIVMEGRDMRLKLEGNVDGIKSTLVRIEEKLDKHLDNGKQVSSIKSGPDFRP